VVDVSLQNHGRHNILNALAALAVADQLGLDVFASARALNAFTGTARRFEVQGEAGGITVIDDYAHHPTEIRATLSAAKARYPGRELWVVWQPHTYSRSRVLLDEFAKAFGDADHVIVTDVYAAREDAPADGFSAQQVAKAIQHPDAHYIPHLTQVTSALLARLRPGDVLLVLSAGDANQVSAHVLTSLTGKHPLAGLS